MYWLWYYFLFYQICQKSSFIPFGNDLFLPFFNYGYFFRLLFFFPGLDVFDFLLDDVFVGLAFCVFLDKTNLSYFCFYKEFLFFWFILLWLFDCLLLLLLLFLIFLFILESVMIAFVLFGAKCFILLLRKYVWSYSLKFYFSLTFWFWALWTTFVVLKGYFNIVFGLALFLFELLPWKD